MTDDFFRIWAVWEGVLYDLTDYFHSQSLAPLDPAFTFLNSDITDVFKQRPGQDITEVLNKVLNGLDETTVNQNTVCLKNVFGIGQIDFRKTARCQTQNYLLIVMSGILMASIGLKCTFTLSSLFHFC